MVGQRAPVPGQAGRGGVEFLGEQREGVGDSGAVGPVQGDGDPRFGETTFRLTNILRGEPAAELFQLPQGYRVTEGRGRRDMLDPNERPPLLRRP